MQDETRRELEFSPEEWGIIIALASPRQGRGSRVGWYASILLPIVVFCVYGAWKQEITAVGLAFICLLGCVLLAIYTDLRNADRYGSICRKIVEFKKSKELPAFRETSS